MAKRILFIVDTVFGSPLFMLLILYAVAIFLWSFIW